LLKDFYVISYFSKPTEFIFRSLESLSDEKHMTILPQFTMDEKNLSEFTKSFANAFAELKKSDANEYLIKSIGSEVFHSLRGSTSVQLINKTIEIEELHLTVREIAKSLSATFQNEAYVGAGYNPHVSHASDNFSSQLTHVGITTYQEEPFRTEILALFDFGSTSKELSAAASDYIGVSSARESCLNTLFSSCFLEPRTPSLKLQSMPGK
jgi:hypothetical protein